MALPSLNELLKQTSRSFYLTAARAAAYHPSPPDRAPYLLARTTDTIADTEIVPVAQRVRSVATTA